MSFVSRPKVNSDSQCVPLSIHEYIMHSRQHRHKDERQDIQKKTFTKWINSHLIKTQCAPVNDLFLDLRDGNRLLALLSVLTDTQLDRRDDLKMIINAVDKS
ncbi:dystrophin, isoforms A/C/F/G/H-like isoform 1-T3 [Glossina fuscipes fuscipes]